MSILLENCWVRYGSEGWVLKNLNLHLESPGSWGVVGPNGAGKTTFLRLLLGILQPEKGALYLEGKPLEQWRPRRRAQKMAFVPQYLPLAFPLTVEKFVTLGLYPTLGLLGSLTSRAKQKIEETLQTLALLPLRDTPMEHLSGGERQRALLAQGLVKEASWILLDEPFNHLDPLHQIQLIQLLQKIKKERNIVVVSHLTHLLVPLVDHYLFFKEGGIVSYCPAKEALQNLDIWKQVFDVPFFKVPVSSSQAWVLPSLEDPHQEC